MAAVGEGGGSGEEGGVGRGEVGGAVVAGEEGGHSLLLFSVGRGCCWVDETAFCVGVGRGVLAWGLSGVEVMIFRRSGKLLEVLFVVVEDRYCLLCLLSGCALSEVKENNFSLFRSPQGAQLALWGGCLVCFSGERKGLWRGGSVALL